MKKILSLLILPVFVLCMEQEESQSFAKFQELPKDIRFEVFNKILIDLTLELLRSDDENRLKIFLDKIANLALVNKEFNDFAHFYIPVRPSDKFPLYSGEVKLYGDDIFALITENNWQKLWDLILSNAHLEQNEKDSLLKWFAIHRNLPMVKKLQELGANVKKACVTIRFTDFNVNVVESFEKNILPYNSEEERQYWLYSAAVEEELDTVKYLLSFGIDYPHKILISAVCNSFMNIFRLSMIYLSENINNKDDMGDTALISAALYCNKGRLDPASPAIIKLLLQYGADPRITDSSVNSPLDLAIEAEYPKL